MKAVIYKNYGHSDVLEIGEVAAPEVGDNDVLVRVVTTSVTTADWRLRAAAFPGIMQVPGRLMFGIRRPKNIVLGGEFSGVVVEKGAKVCRFEIGDAVFGFSGQGAYGEFVKVAEDAAILPKPDALSHEDAAALPFGGIAALVFLRDFARVSRNEKVLIVGASGGVGAYAVQIAKHLGADVTGISSAGNLELIRRLGADHVVDYRSQDFTTNGNKYEVIFDTVGAVSYARVRNSLSENGRFVPLNFGICEIFQSFMAAILGSKRLVIGVNGDTQADLETLVRLIKKGALQAVIDRVYPLRSIRDAHRYVEGRHRKGAVVVRSGELWSRTKALDNYRTASSDSAEPKGLATV